MNRFGSRTDTIALIVVIGLWSTCAVAQDMGDAGGTSTYGWDDQGPFDRGDDFPIDRNDIPDDRDNPSDDRGRDRRIDRSNDIPPEPSLVREPSIGDIIADGAGGYAVKTWSDYEEAAHESLVNHKDGSSAYTGYDPGMTKDGFKTFRTRGTAITVSYIVGERFGSLTVKYAIGRTRLGRTGGWQGVIIGQAVDFVAGEVGDVTGGGMAVIGSLITNSDVISYNVRRMLEITLDPWTYEQPFSGWPFRPNW